MKLVTLLVQTLDGLPVNDVSERRLSATQYPASAAVEAVQLLGSISFSRQTFVSSVFTRWSASRCSQVLLDCNVCVDG